MRFRVGIAILAQQVAHLLAILFWLVVAQFLFKGLAQRIDVPVLTKDQRNHQPVVASADLAILARVPEECASFPASYVRSGPGGVDGLGVKSGGVMHHIHGGEQAAACNGLVGAAHGHAIHCDLRAGGKVPHCELVLGRNRLA